MSRRERDQFVTQSAGQSCIAYQLRPDGTMVTRSFWRGTLRPFRRVQFAVVAVLATLLPFFFAACASRRTTLGEVAHANGAHSGGDQVEQDCAVTLGVPMPPEAIHRKKK